MTFGFYNRNDNNRELIKSGEFVDLAQAVEFFAAMKGLSQEAFLDLFTVILIKRRQDGRF